MYRMLMIIFSCFSLSFAGTLWLGLGTSASATADGCMTDMGYYICGSDDIDLDDGGLELGYTHMLKQEGKMGWGLGGSYHLAAMGEDGFEAQFLTLYGIGTYGLSESMGAWFALGLGLPQGDIDDGDTGLAYSLGLMYNLNEKMMLGLGYTVNNTSLSDLDGDFDYEFSRMTLNFGYRM